jgi:hypothetical protein
MEELLIDESLSSLQAKCKNEKVGTESLYKFPS